MELADFLRTRRARVTPQDLGLPPYPGRRKVPGLRREEVAQLAGVSVDYYVRLEQGRGVNVSAAVLDAVARALRLDAGERAHLHRLAHPRPPRRADPPQQVRPAVRHLLDAMSGTAAYVVGRRTDVLAWNRLGAQLIVDFDTVPPRRRNFARLMFGDEPFARSVFLDWPTKARELVAFLRVDSGRHPNDPALADLVAELTLCSALFRQLWAEHPVRDKGHSTAVVRGMELAFEALRLPDDPDQVLVTYSSPIALSALATAATAATTHR